MIPLPRSSPSLFSVHFAFALLSMVVLTSLPSNSNVNKARAWTGLLLSLYPTALAGNIEHSCYTADVHLIKVNYE